MRFAHAAAAVAVTAVAFAMSAGCSEPVPVSADGAFFLATIQDDPLKCSHAGHTVQVGAVDSVQKTTVIIDGTDQITVDCNVVSLKESGAPFKVQGKIDAQLKSGNYMEIAIPSISPSATADAPAAGSIVFSDPKTAGQPYSGSCDFYFEQKNQTVADGRIWVSFKCDALTSGMSTCPLKQGYAIFENCLTLNGDE
ncbi:Hypothetical protein A7982_11502 [Minicystis rosea]|nr:Hypothetical protein A7982_11502 [Minicystis rosea]